MRIRPEPVPGQRSATEKDEIDNELERILTLPPVRKGRHTATKHETRDEHELGRRPEREAARGREWLLRRSRVGHLSTC